jgi:uncharacterized membrane protein required for colicin V production
VVLLVLLLLLSSAISNKIKQSILSGLDRTAGGLIGILRGISLPFFVCSMFLILNIDRKKFEPVKNSRISFVLFGVAEAVMPEMENTEPVKEIRKKQKDITKMMQKVQMETMETIDVSTFKIKLPSKNNGIGKKTNNKTSKKVQMPKQQNNKQHKKN